MKTIKFVSMAAVAVLLSSCSQNEIDERTLPQSKAIKFENLSNVLSKGANDVNSDYGIFGFKGNTVYSEMRDVRVDGTTNSYSPLRYWPSDGSSLSFWGYAPWGSTNVDLTGMNNTGYGTNDGSYKVVYTVPVSANEDFTLGQGTSTNSFTTGNVQIDFTHMLSKIELGSVSLIQELVDAGYMIDYTGATISLFVNVNKGENALNTRAAWSGLQKHPDPASADQIEYSGSKTYYIMPQSAVANDSLRIQLKGVTIIDPLNGVRIVDLVAKWIANKNESSSDFNAFTYGHKYQVNFVIGGDAQIVDPTDPGNGGGTDPDGGGEDLFPEAISFTTSLVSWIDSNMNFN